jgi:L-rhamnose mutarotase
MGHVISLKQGAVAEYNPLHSAVWPEVLQVIHDANIRNYNNLPQRVRKPSVRLLGISRDEFRRGCGQDA